MKRFFSDVVEEVGNGNWILSEKSPLVYQISKSKVQIQFFPDNTKLIFGENEYDIQLTDFSKIRFEDKTETKESGETETKSILIFDGKEQFELINDKMSPYKELFEKLSNLFTSDDMTPLNQVKEFIDEYELNEKSSYNPDIYKILLTYKNRIETAFNNGFLHEKSTIIALLEDDSGKITENLGQTVKKGLGGALSGGLGGLVGFGLGIAKAGASRVAKNFVKDITKSESIMILTNRNVILAKLDEINEYDFEDASDIFEARQDDTLAGVVDIYDDCENKILDNIAQTKWNFFKTQLRKIKKEAEQSDMGNETEATTTDGDDDGFAEAEKRITKLKKLLDSGLISQEDFDLKKAEILNSI